MSILVVGEIVNGNLKKISREMTSAGRKIADGAGSSLNVLLIGAGAKNLSDDVKSCGADAVIAVESAEFSPEGYANIIAEAINDKSAKVVLMPHTAQGKDYSPRVAVKVKSGIIADVVEFEIAGSEIIAKKPIYSGKAYAKLKLKTDIKLFTLRANSQDVVEKDGAGSLEEASYSAGEVKLKTSAVNENTDSKVQLGDASIIVSGGRGMKGPEHFAMLQDLCNVVGGAMGASRAAVDAGWIAHSHQVGQTGKTVSPNCYIACGISGAIQHLAGMGSSKYIVAINKDPDAPIFKVATYGIVADLFDVVPALTEEFKKVLG